MVGGQHGTVRPLRPITRRHAQCLLAGSDQYRMYRRARRLDATGRALEAAQRGAGDSLVCVQEGSR